MGGKPGWGLRVCDSLSVDLGRRGVGNLSKISPCSTGLAKVPFPDTFDLTAGCSGAAGSNVGLPTLLLWRTVVREGVSLGRAQDRWRWQVVHP